MTSPDPPDTSDTPAAFDEDELREYFAGRLPDRLREIDQAWQRVRETAWTGDALKTFHRLVHSLAGAGTTFGFPAVTEASRVLERRLKAVLRDAEPPLDPAVVEDLLSRLRQAAAHP